MGMVGSVYRLAYRRRPPGSPPPLTLAEGIPGDWLHGLLCRVEVISHGPGPRNVVVRLMAEDGTFTGRAVCVPQRNLRRPGLETPNA